MLKVTLEFNTVEEAIVTLGKLADIATPAKEKKTRKVPPGEEAIKAEAIAKAATPDVPAPPPEPKEEVPAAEVPVPPSTSRADAQAALERFFNSKGVGATAELLSRYGVKRVRELQDAQLGEFVTEIDGLVPA